MKTLKFSFDHFTLNGDLLPGFGMLKDLHLELLKPENTLEVLLKAPFMQSLRFEFRLDAYQDGVLTLFILSKQKVIDALLNLAERFVKMPKYIRIDYPYFYLDLGFLMRESFPAAEIREISIANGHYQITLELT